MIVLDLLEVSFTFSLPHSNLLWFFNGIVNFIVEQSWWALCLMLVAMCCWGSCFLFILTNRKFEPFAFPVYIALKSAIISNIWTVSTVRILDAGVLNTFYRAFACCVWKKKRFDIYRNDSSNLPQSEAVLLNSCLYTIWFNIFIPLFLLLNTLSHTLSLSLLVSNFRTIAEVNISFWWLA